MESSLAVFGPVDAFSFKFTEKNYTLLFKVVACIAMLAMIAAMADYFLVEPVEAWSWSKSLALAAAVVVVATAGIAAVAYLAGATTLAFLAGGASLVSAAFGGGCWFFGELAGEAEELIEKRGELSLQLQQAYADRAPLKQSVESLWHQVLPFDELADDHGFSTEELLEQIEGEIDPIMSPSQYQQYQDLLNQHNQLESEIESLERLLGAIPSTSTLESKLASYQTKRNEYASKESAVNSIVSSYEASSYDTAQEMIDDMVSQGVYLTQSDVDSMESTMESELDYWDSMLSSS